MLAIVTARTAAGTWRMTGVDTSQGRIDLAPGGVVVIALGTIESARLALASFDGSGLPTLPLMGKNLMAHLRSNLVFRVPRTAIPGLSATINELQTAALFVKGRATRPNGDLLGHFHLQIAASGGGSTVGAEDELFRKVPDVDFLRSAAHLDRHACGHRDPRHRRDGAGGSDQSRRTSEPRGPRPAHRRVRRAARGGDADADAARQ